MLMKIGCHFYIVFKKWSLLDISPSPYGYFNITPYKHFGIFNIVEFNRVSVYTVNYCIVLLKFYYDIS
jgi:hypothetical protein